MRRRVIRALFAGAMCLLAVLPSLAAQASYPGSNGKLVFVRSDDDPNTPNVMWTANPDGSGQAPLGGPGTDQGWPVWSPDGGRVAFTEKQDHNHLYTIEADGSGVTPLTEEGNWEFPTWRPDGQRLAVTRCFIFSGGSSSCRISQVDADGTDYTENFPPFPNANTYDWSPSGAMFAFAGNPSGSSASDIYTSNADHTGAVNLTNHPADDEWPSWSPDNQRIVFESNRDGDDDIWAINADGTGLVQLTDDPAPDSAPVWSPDGTKIAFWTMRSGDGDIYAMNADGSDETPVITGSEFDYTPDWQPIPINSYARPKGATPVRASLVRAFAPCVAPSKTHGPPLAFPSCGAPPQSPPAPHPAISPNVNVGTADTNNAPADFVGSVRMDVVPGNPATPADEADVSVSVRASDLRCFFASSVPACGPQNAADGDDYTGELQGALNVRITDKDNTPHPGGPGAGTVQDSAIEFAIPCTATSATLTGGLCNLTSSMDALVPGAAVEGRRSIWQLGQVQVFDGGPDADADTADNSLFATQGVWIP